MDGIYVFTCIDCSDGVEKFNVNVFIAVVIACALVSPDYIAMVNAGDPVKFLGIPVQLLSLYIFGDSDYSGNLDCILCSEIFDKVLPIVVRNLFYTNVYHCDYGSSYSGVRSGWKYNRRSNRYLQYTLWLEPDC